MTQMQLKNFRMFIPAHFGGSLSNIYNEFIKWHFGWGKKMGVILYNWIREHKCRRIMEIGVDTGENAKRLIEAAKENFDPLEVGYYGFDIFEKQKPADEVSRSGYTEDYIWKKLNKTGAINGGYSYKTQERLEFFKEIN